MQHTVARHCDDGFGTPGSAEYSLVKGRAYTFSLRWVATNRGDYPDYDWRARINDSIGAGGREGLYGTGAFIVEDPDELLQHEEHGDDTDITIGKEGRIIVPRIRLEPVTCATTGAGVIVNPSGVAAGGLAAYRVEVEPEDAVEDADIHWSVASGGVAFYAGRNTGRESVIRGGAAESDFKLEVQIGDLPETCRPYIHGRVLEPKAVQVRAYVICDSNGVEAVSAATINEWITEANRIYRQVAVTFTLANIVPITTRPEWFDIVNLPLSKSYATLLSNLWDSTEKKYQISQKIDWIEGVELAQIKTSRHNLVCNYFGTDRTHGRVRYRCHPRPESQSIRRSVSVPLR